jgi:hypothetical protein
MTRAVFILLALCTAGCDVELLDPSAGADLPEGLAVSFTVAPAEVAQHAPFTAELRITNTTAEPLSVVTSSGCLAVPHVMRNGTRVPFRGSWWGCFGAVTTHSFEPGQTHVVRWDMTADLYPEHPGDVDGAPAPRGTYRVTAEFSLFIDDQVRRAQVQRTLRVD